MTTIRQDLEFDFLPDVSDAKAQLALALFREGLSLEHGPYSFLSFFKILNVFARGNSAQKKWIKKNIGAISSDRARKRLIELGSYPSGQQIQDYIYKAGRAAVAHASIEDIHTVDPDDPEHELRLYMDLPIIEALAKHLINNEFRVKTREDIWNSKIHRIAGAIWMIGPTTVECIKKLDCVGRRIVDLPRFVDIRSEGHGQMKSLSELLLKVRCVRKGVVFLEIQSKDALLSLSLSIDFKNGELNFDPLNEQICLDDGTISSAERIAELNQFISEILCNGQCQLVESGTGCIIAEAKAYVPINMIFNPEKSREITDHWRAIAAERRKANLD